MWDAARRRGARAHRRAPGRRGRRRRRIGVCSQYSSIVPDRRAGAAGRADADVAGPARHRPLVRDHEPRRERVHDVRRAPRHPADRQRPLARPHPLPAARPARRARAHRRVRRGDGLRDRAPHRPHHRVAAHVVHGAAAATTARSARPRTTTSSCSSPASTPTRLPPLVPVDDAIGTLLPDVADDARAARDGRRVRADQRHRGGRGRDRRVHRRAGPGSSIGTTSVLVDAVADFRTDLEHQILSMPGPYVDRYVVCAENGLGGKVLEHVLEQRRVRGRRARRPPRRRRRSRALDAVLAATEPGAGGVMFLPWLGGSLAPGRERHDARRLRATCRSRPSRRRPRARGRGRRRAQPRVAAAARRDVHRRARSTRSRSSAARRARRSGARCSPTCSTGRSSPLAAPDVARSRARWRCSRSSAHGVLARADLDRGRGGDAHRFEPDPARHERYAYRQVQFEAAYAALLPISEALVMSTSYPYATDPRRDPRHAVGRTQPRLDHRRARPTSPTTRTRRGRRASARARCTAATTSTTTSWAARSSCSRT